jgi:hypothetical protein
MKPPLDGTPDQPTLPMLRVLCYLERQEYSLEWGEVEYANRWYTPAMHLMRDIYRNEVWK